MPFDREKAAALLKSDAYTKASPEVKQAIVNRLRAEASDAGVATPKETVSAKPKFGVKDALEIAIARPTSPAAKSVVYTAIDRALPFLPAAGATIGGMLAGPESGFLASVPAAAAGGATGELLREQLNHAIYGEELPSAKDEAANLAGQAALGGASEFGARGSGKAIGKVLKPFAESAATVKAAKVGTGVRMTPGEAAESSTLRRVEELLTHMPGATAPMEKFRAAQLADANRLTADQVAQFGAGQMNDHQTGQMVQQSLRGHATPPSIPASQQLATSFDDVKRLLGIDPKTFMTPAQLDEAVAKKVAFYKQMGGETPEVAQRLTDARRAFAAQSKLAQTEKAAGKVAANTPRGKLVTSLLKSSPEQIVQQVQSGLDLAQLREFNALVPEPARRQVQANLLQNLLNKASDPQTGTLDQRALAKGLKDLGEQRGALIFGKQWKALKEGSALLNKIAPLSTNQTGGLGKMHTMRLLIQAGEAAHTLLLAPVFAATGHSTLAAAAALAPAGEVGAMRFISLALAHPQTSAAMLKILRGLAVTGARAIPYGVDAALLSPADVHTQAPAQ